MRLKRRTALSNRHVFVKSALDQVKTHGFREETMKLKNTRKLKEPQANGSKSRDKVRKIYSDIRAAEKSGKISAPLAERRSGTRAARHKSKGLLKQIEMKFNG